MHMELLAILTALVQHALAHEGTAEAYLTIRVVSMYEKCWHEQCQIVMESNRECFMMRQNNKAVS